MDTYLITKVGPLLNHYYILKKSNGVFYKICSQMGVSEVDDHIEHIAQMRDDGIKNK